MAGWMINCEEYASLLSQSLDQPLSFFEKLTVKMHMILCPPCKHIQKHFDAIRNACRCVPDGSEAVDTEEGKLSNETCERIKSALRENVRGK